MPEESEEIQNQDIDIDDLLSDIFRSESSDRKNDFENESDNDIRIENESSEDITNKIIDNANKYFLVKVLSPQIEKNEAKKREHKNVLIQIVKLFLIFQFVIILILLFGIIIMIFVFHGFNNDLELSYLEKIINFVSIYITSVVVELIAMLKYIVANVFDTSITSLVELYKDASSND